jgi:progressive ankylosis protein
MSPQERRNLGLADAYRFFTPLILMTELNMISKSAIHAFLARADNPGATLAAFNTAFTFYYAITSASEVTAPLALAWLKGRAELGYLFGFMVLIMGVPLALVGITSFTSAGEWFYGDVFGLGKRATADAQLTAGILLVSAPILLARGLAFALLMRARLTLLITSSTLIRLVSLAGSLAFWPFILDGAAIGAAALVTCMAVETTFAWAFAWRQWRALPPQAPRRPGYWSMWQFAWPLAMNQSAELGVVFTINIFLGRLPGAELAIAAFGVAHGLVGVLLGPMRNLSHTAQTLLAKHEDVRVLLIFSAQLALLGAVGCIVLFNTPLTASVLHDLMGLDAQLAAACEPSLRFAVLICAFWAFAALFRGMLANARTTGALALTGGLRVAVAALVGTIGAWHGNVDGATLGMFAWIASYAIEMTITAHRLRQLNWFIPASEGS